MLKNDYETLLEVRAALEAGNVDEALRIIQERVDFQAAFQATRESMTRRKRGT